VKSNCLSLGETILLVIGRKKEKDARIITRDQILDKGTAYAGCAA